MSVFDIWRRALLVRTRGSGDTAEMPLTIEPRAWAAPAVAPTAEESALPAAVDAYVLTQLEGASVRVSLGTLTITTTLGALCEELATGVNRMAAQAKTSIVLRGEGNTQITLVAADLDAALSAARALREEGLARFAAVARGPVATLGPLVLPPAAALRTGAVVTLTNAPTLRERLAPFCDEALNVILAGAPAIAAGRTFAETLTSFTEHGYFVLQTGNELWAAKVSARGVAALRDSLAPSVAGPAHAMKRLAWVLSQPLAASFVLDHGRVRPL